MANEPVYFSTLSNDAPTYVIADRTYTLAEKRLIIGQFAQKYNMPQRGGKTLRIVRHNRFNLPREPLVEGVAPDAQSMTLTQVDITCEQWGLVAHLTDVVQITLHHPVLAKAIELTALAMAETMEREQCVMLMAGTNVLYPGSVSSRAGLANSNIMTSAVVGKAVAGLRTMGAPDYGMGNYKGVMHPNQEEDLLASDSTFITAMSQSSLRNLQYNEVGHWRGVDWSRSNFMPVFQGVAAATTGAATAERALYATATTGGTMQTGNYQLVIVGREVTTDYERKISVQTGNIAVTGPTGSISIGTPTSTNYTYDVYVTAVGATTPYKVKSRVAAATTVVITAEPAGTEATPPAQVAVDVSVYVAWVFGKDAFARVTLDGMSLQSYLTPPGASFSNPLAQGRKVGHKVMWKSAIVDNEFFRRIETSSALADGLPV